MSLARRLPRPVSGVAAAGRPERRGWFLEYYEESKSWVPAGFRSFTEYEDKSATLRVWSPGIVHGLLQTEAYARELLSVSPGATEEMIKACLASRMERQRRVLMRDDPPSVWFVVDEVALYRYVGSPEIMAAQMERLIDVANLAHVTKTVMPTVTHPGNEPSWSATPLTGTAGRWRSPLTPGRCSRAGSRQPRVTA